MPSISSNVTIATSPSTVRKVVLDFASYPQWNPLLTSVQLSDPAAPPGTPVKITVWKFIVYKVTIVENDAATFSWGSVIINKKFFQNLHKFKFESFGDEVGENGEAVKCKFVQSEDFGGFLSIFSFIYGPILKNGFKKMNKALKVKVEAAVAGGGA